jgi:nicotinate phosphoribosyltransferase
MIVDVKDPTRRKRLADGAGTTDLLVTWLTAGKPVREAEPLAKIRQRTTEQLAQLHPTIRRFLHPHEYPVGLDIGLHELRDAMIHTARHAQLKA